MPVFARRRFVLLTATIVGVLAGLHARPDATAQAAPPTANNAVRSGSLLSEALEGPMAGVDEIIFAVRAPGRDGHWYANFGYHSSNENQMQYGVDGGRLLRLNLRTGQLKTILDDPGGGVRDPHVHYDGEKVLFSYRRSGSRHYHLYEIAVDGSGLRQLTDGPWDDIEAIYLPDGEIMFCSSRCKRWVQCWHTHVAVRYRCDGDGRNIRIISSNVEQDNTPWMLPDGRVLYMRWEYVDRSRVRYHHLWTSYPDGTGEMVYYGNMHPGTVMLDAKPIPGTNKVVSIFSPGHGRREHAGKLTIVDQKAGPDDRSHARTVADGVEYRDPYAFSEDCFMSAEGSSLLLIDGQGRREVIFALEGDDGKTYWCHEPRPLRSRSRERVTPDRVKPAQQSGRLILADVNYGRNMKGVERGEIKKLLILETLPKPVNHSGTMEPTSLGGTFTLERILGTVPVESDGSAHVEVPPLRSLFFVALDENDLSVKRMQSFVNVMPGETTSCVGCHENRTDSARLIERQTLKALERPPSEIQPIAGVPEVIDFPHDVQPILDRHCVKCHGYAKREGGLGLAGDHGPIYSHSYTTLMITPGLISHGRDADGNISPRGIGSSASRLMQLLDGSHYEAKLSTPEIRLIRLWIDTGAVYAGTYAALGTGMMPRQNIDPNVYKARCVGCHKGNPPGRQELHFSLTHPERSLVLMAPLSKKAGGYGLCRTSFDKNAPPADVFRDTDDPDYRKMLASIAQFKDRHDQTKRFDMPGFKPSPHYVREMKRFGILAADFDLAEDPIDAYTVDREYWQSLWWEPPRH